MLHLDLEKPIELNIEKKFMYSMDESIKGRVKAKVFSLSSYEGEALTFQAVLDDGSLFSYIPIHLLSHKKKVKNRLDLDDLIYFNCPDMDIVINSYDFLKKSTPMCYFKNKNIWMKGEYLFTVEWYNGNLNGHLIKLENGQFAFLPSHKINFSGIKKLEKYHKIRNTWKL